MQHPRSCACDFEYALCTGCGALIPHSRLDGENCPYCAAVALLRWEVVDIPCPTHDRLPEGRSERPTFEKGSLKK